MIEEANNYFSIGKDYASIDCYNRVLKLDSDNIIALNGKGRLLCELEKYDEAIKCYDKSIELNPDNPSTYRGKAEVYRRKLKIWKLIVLAIAGGWPIGLGISLFVPFPYSCAYAYDSLYSMGTMVI